MAHIKELSTSKTFKIAVLFNQNLFKTGKCFTSPSIFGIMASIQRLINSNSFNFAALYWKLLRKLAFQFPIRPVRFFKILNSGAHPGTSKQQNLDDCSFVQKLVVKLAWLIFYQSLHLRIIAPIQGLISCKNFNCTIWLNNLLTKLAFFF